LSVLSIRSRTARLGWTAAAALVVLVGPARAQVLEIGDDGVARQVGGGWSRPAAVRPSRPTARLRGEIEAAAAANGLDADFLEAVARTESGLDPTAVSPAGAIGVMQLMPTTAQALGVDPRDPAQNIMGGARYLRAQLDRFEGRIDLALAAYNAGADRVRQYGGVPPFRETRAYVGRNLERLAQASEAGQPPHHPEGADR
jgi:soluble lytic murein transglycosylase-like protein